jgi:hypothetical protein
MAKEPLQEDQPAMVSSTAGRDLFMGSMRRVLERHGYHGAALEAKIAALLQKDVSRLAAIIARPRRPKA